MNHTEFTELLQQLPEAEWQDVLDGAAILNVEDTRLQTGDKDAHNVFVNPDDFEANDTAELKQQVLQQAQALRDAYYASHPLMQKHFNLQALQLVDQYGHAAFVAQPGEKPAYTLFVDAGQVVAEPPDSPRFRYGIYHELEQQLNESALRNAFNNWLQSGMAHQHYLCMWMPL